MGRIVAELDDRKNEVIRLVQRIESLVLRDGDCLRAGDPAFHLNLMSLFRQAVLKASALHSDGRDIQHTLKTLRYKLFAQAGYTTTDGRKDILKLAIAMRQRQWMEGLWDRSKTFSLPVCFTPVFSSA